MIPVLTLAGESCVMQSAMSGDRSAAGDERSVRRGTKAAVAGSEAADCGDEKAVASSCFAVWSCGLSSFCRTLHNSVYPPSQARLNRPCRDVLLCICKQEVWAQNAVNLRALHCPQCPKGHAYRVGGWRGGMIKKRGRGEAERKSEMFTERQTMDKPAACSTNQFCPPATEKIWTSTLMPCGKKELDTGYRGRRSGCKRGPGQPWSTDSPPTLHII